MDTSLSKILSLLIASANVWTTQRSGQHCTKKPVLYGATNLVYVASIVYEFLSHQAFPTPTARSHEWTEYKGSLIGGTNMFGGAKKAKQC